MKRYEHNPVPPGAVLREVMEEKAITFEDLRLRLGLSNQATTDLLSGKTRLTPMIAQQLDDLLNIPARIWLNLEHDYQSISMSKDFQRYAETLERNYRARKAK